MSGEPSAPTEWPARDSFDGLKTLIAAEHNRLSQVPHRGVRVIEMDGGEAKGPFGHRRCRHVPLGARPPCDRAREDGRSARVVLFQAECLACLLRQGRIHRPPR